MRCCRITNLLCPFLSFHAGACSFYSSAAAGREALASTIPVRRLREAIAREDKFVARLAESVAAELGASGTGGSGVGAGGAGVTSGGGGGYTYGSPAFSPLRAGGGGGKEAWELTTPSPGEPRLSRSTRVQGKFEVDGRDVRVGIARHMYDHVHSGAASTPPDWQRTKKDTFYHLKTRSSDERPVSQPPQQQLPRAAASRGPGGLQRLAYHLPLFSPASMARWS